MGISNNIILASLANNKYLGTCSILYYLSCFNETKNWEFDSITV